LRALFRSLLMLEAVGVCAIVLSVLLFDKVSSESEKISLNSRAFVVLK